MWSDFNAANKTAMLKSEMLSWPLTLVLLVFAFGTLVAAGLPLLLTMAGLLGAGGLLFVFGQFADVSIWAMNFAMMFAIALGIDYALFIVVRFRSALAAGLAPREATALTMATAGKAVLVSGLTVIAALLALTLVPVPAFRTVPLGIGLAVLMVLAATLTLLPAVLSHLRSPDQRRPRAHARGDRSSQRALRGVGRPAVGAAASVRRRGRRDPAAAFERALADGEQAEALEGWARPRATSATATPAWTHGHARSAPIAAALTRARRPASLDGSPTTRSSSGATTPSRRAGSAMPAGC